MPLMADYAITPDVFDPASYGSVAECEARIDLIRDVLLDEGLVRDLRDGAWRELFLSESRPWHRRGVELAKKLVSQGRLIRCRSALADSPQDDRDWCAEALETHEAQALRGGVIVTDAIKAQYHGEPLVARIDRLGSAAWWRARSPSVTVARTIEDYAERLDLLLRNANSLRFIDPYLDPAKPGYRELGRLLSRAGHRRPTPVIELHRACYEGSGPRRRFPLREDPGYFERRFRDEIGDQLQAAGLAADIFVWDDFHDRYLISNLAGILLSNGFDVLGDPHAEASWARLGRDHRDRIQREFHPDSERHRLQARFRVP